LVGKFETAVTRFVGGERDNNGKKIGYNYGGEQAVTKNGRALRHIRIHTERTEEIQNTEKGIQKVAPGFGVNNCLLSGRMAVKL
jgi:hypothetical protein